MRRTPTSPCWRWMASQSAPMCDPARPARHSSWEVRSGVRLGWSSSFLMRYQPRFWRTCSRRSCPVLGSSRRTYSSSHCTRSTRPIQPGGAWSVAVPTSPVQPSSPHPCVHDVTSFAMLPQRHHRLCRHFSFRVTWGTDWLPGCCAKLLISQPDRIVARDSSVRRPRCGHLQARTGALLAVSNGAQPASRQLCDQGGDGRPVPSTARVGQRWSRVVYARDARRNSSHRNHGHEHTSPHTSAFRLVSGVRRGHTCDQPSGARALTMCSARSGREKS